MGVRRGTATPSKVYRGTVPVKKIMRGTVEVWSASIYPLSGTWTGTVAPYAEGTATHTIVEAGNYTLTWEVNSTNGAFAEAQIRTPTGSSSGGYVNPSRATYTGALSPGNVVTFAYFNADVISANAVGSWSIVKN